MSQPNKKKSTKAPKGTTGKGGIERGKAFLLDLLDPRAGVMGKIYLALTILAGVAVAGFLWFQWFSSAPDVDRLHAGNEDARRRPDQVVITTDELGNEIEMVIPGLPEDRKKEFYTFLVVGQSQDEGGKLTDTMMMAAYDVPNQTLSVMSLPRDTYVNYNGRTRLINEVYNAAGGDKDGRGIAGLKSAVRDLTGVYPDFHIIVQWEAVGELVDAIGGVYYEVPFDMYYNDLSQHFKIDLKKGYQLLNGEKAMGLVRWRHNSDDKGNISKTYGYAEGDIGRIKTQQAFLKEVIKKCLKMDVLVTNLAEYVSIFQRNVDTNLTASNLAYFVKSAMGGLDIDNVSFVTLPWVSANNSHILPVGSKIVQEINKGFNPYEVDIRQGELKLATMDDVPRSHTATPTPDPDATPNPGATRAPGDDDDDDDDDLLLPPGAITRPSASPGQSPRPGQTARPGETPRPGQSARPGETQKPAQSQAPGSLTSTPPATASAKPADEPEATPRPTAASSGGGEDQPSAPPQAPSATDDDDEPILPPM